jgi:secernin
MTALAERYGQGGSGYADKDWPYHNSFLVADRRDAFRLETSDRRWALRRVRDLDSASNHLGIGDDWDALADGTIEHAVAQGWWPEEAAGRFDFAAAYRDTSMAPAVVSSGRHRRTCELLAAARGRLTPATLRAALRDHYGAATPGIDLPYDDEHRFGVCMHADPVGTTTASLVARLPAAGPPQTWISLGAPCVGIFLPAFLTGELPAALARGGAEPTDDSPWWRFKALLTLVERDWPRYLSPVRAAWDDLERRLDADAATAAGRETAFMHDALARVLAKLEQLLAELQ